MKKFNIEKINLDKLKVGQEEEKFRREMRDLKQYLSEFKGHYIRYDRKKHRYVNTNNFTRFFLETNYYKKNDDTEDIVRDMQISQIREIGESKLLEDMQLLEDIVKKSPNLDLRVEALEAIIKIGGLEAFWEFTDNYEDIDSSFVEVLFNVIEDIMEDNKDKDEVPTGFCEIFTHSM